MGREVVLERKAKEAILEQMDNLTEINTETVTALILPHMHFNPKKAKEQQARKKANQLIASRKGSDGVQSWYACKDKYVNVEKTKSVEDLDIVEQSLTQKYTGLNKSKEKIQRQREILSGQLIIENNKELVQ